MFDKTLNEIQDRLDRITPGEWSAYLPGNKKYSREVYCIDKVTADMAEEGIDICEAVILIAEMQEPRVGSEDDNAKFIAHAPRDIKTLLNITKGLQQAILEYSRCGMSCKMACFACSAKGGTECAECGSEFKNWMFSHERFIPRLGDVY